MGPALIIAAVEEHSDDVFARMRDSDPAAVAWAAVSHRPAAQPGSRQAHIVIHTRICV